MDNRQLFRLIREIADMAYDYANSTTGLPLVLSDYRGESVNPFYYQTESGLFLELYYGKPSKIWTPWGSWRCWGSGEEEWGNVMSQFLQRLGAVEHQPLSRTHAGEFGPVYAITSVDGVPLPRATERAHGQYMAYEDAKAAWQSMLKDYEQGVNAGQEI
jgi:hypothetical protein